MSFKDITIYFICNENFASFKEISIKKPYEINCIL